MADGQGRLVAVVVTHNRLEQLKRTLARLLESGPEALAAVVVADNASSDGTPEWLAAQQDARLVVTRSQENCGGAGGFARGMALAMADCAPDWLVLMDDDGRPHPGALEAFHGLDLTGWDGIAAAVYFPDGEICEMNRPSRNPFWHGRVFLRSLLRLGGRSGFHLDPGVYAGTEPVSIDITSFVGFFVRAEAVAQAGYPDPALFVYGDDGLYTLGLRQAGRRLAFHPQVRFEHALSTFAGQRGRFRPLWKVYYYHRNLLLLYRAAAGPLFWPLMAVIGPRWLLKGRSHAGERRAFYRLLRAALRDGLRGDLSRDHAAVLRLAEEG
jgi:GT2 family glycosyltransferase